MSARVVVWVTQAELARQLDVKPSTVSRRIRSLGIPVVDGKIDQGLALMLWRDWTDPAQQQRARARREKNRHQPPAEMARRRTFVEELGEFAGDLFITARDDICAGLVVELGITLEQANVATSAVLCALSDACDAMGIDGWYIGRTGGGPLAHGVMSEGDRDATRARLEARIAALRAEDAEDE